MTSDTPVATVEVQSDSRNACDASELCKIDHRSPHGARHDQPRQRQHQKRHRNQRRRQQGEPAPNATPTPAAPPLTLPLTQRDGVARVLTTRFPHRDLVRAPGTLRSQHTLPDRREPSSTNAEATAALPLLVRAARSDNQWSIDIVGDFDTLDLGACGFTSSRTPSRSTSPSCTLVRTDFTSGSK